MDCVLLMIHHETSVLAVLVNRYAIVLLVALIIYGFTKMLLICIDAEWMSREDVKRSLTLTKYGKAQKTAASKVDQICKGVGKGQNLAADFGVESGELVPMFVHGRFAIAHQLISSWAHQVSFHDIKITK